METYYVRSAIPPHHNIIFKSKFMANKLFKTKKIVETKSLNIDYASLTRKNIFQEKGEEKNFVSNIIYNSIDSKTVSVVQHSSCRNRPNCV